MITEKKKKSVCVWKNHLDAGSCYPGGVWSLDVGVIFFLVVELSFVFQNNGPETVKNTNQTLLQNKAKQENKTSQKQKLLK